MEPIESDRERQNYELAYHIRPTIPETEVAQIRQEIEQLLTAQGAVITYSKEPEKARLSYPVQHERSSFFGYVQFNLPPGEGLAHVDEQLRLNTRLLRHIVLKLEADAEKQKAAAKAKISQERFQERAKRPAAQPITPQDSERIEQKIEEIIGNL